MMNPRAIAGIRWMRSRHLSTNVRLQGALLKRSHKRSKRLSRYVIAHCRQMEHNTIFVYQFTMFAVHRLDQSQSCPGQAPCYNIGGTVMRHDYVPHIAYTAEIHLKTFAFMLYLILYARASRPDHPLAGCNVEFLIRSALVAEKKCLNDEPCLKNLDEAALKTFLHLPANAEVVRWLCEEMTKHISYANVCSCSFSLF